MLLAGCQAARSRTITEIDARSGVYADNDATTIQTHTLTIAAKPTDELTVSARRLVDFTSSASVDVVSAATGRWTELRHETEGNLAWERKRNTLGGGYIYSTENDWWSHTGSLGGSRTYFDKDLTLGLGGSYGTNRIGRADDENFEEHLTSVSGTGSAVIVGSPRDIWKLTYALTRLDGYQASPYRFARILDDTAPPDFPIAAPEVLPERRIRHALSVRYNRLIKGQTVLRSHARGYVDDWGVASLTGGTESVFGYKTLEVGVLVRGYVQRAATFYQDGYDTERRYMTADRELSSFYDVFGGGRVRWKSKAIGKVVDQLRAEVKVVGFGFVFHDFDRLPHREGVVAEAGFGGSF